MLARAGSQIDNVIGRAHHIGIVLHHHDGVTQPAQLFQNANQPAGIAAVQPDRRLVEHVACAHQARPQAGGKLDALRFAARKRRGQAVQREVLESDVVQEFEPLANLHQISCRRSRPPPAKDSRQLKNRCASAIFIRTTSARFLPPTRT